MTDLLTQFHIYFNRWKPCLFIFRALKSYTRRRKVSPRKMSSGVMNCKDSFLSSSKLYGQYNHTDRSHFWGPVHSKIEEFRHSNRRFIKGCIILYIVRIFSSSELVEPHIIPLKVRVAVALKEEAKWQVFVWDSLVPSRPRRFRMWRHLSSLSGKSRTPRAIALGSKPPLVTRIARTGLGTRLCVRLWALNLLLYRILLGIHLSFCN